MNDIDSFELGVTDSLWDGACLIDRLSDGGKDNLDDRSTLSDVDGFTDGLSDSAQLTNGLSDGSKDGLDDGSTLSDVDSFTDGIDVSSKEGFVVSDTEGASLGISVIRL